MSVERARGQYHHGDLRQALLNASLELVQEKGTRGFSLNEAARRAGVSSAAPYRHFADKEAVLDALAHDAFGRLHEVLEEASSAATGDFDAEMAALVRAYVGFALESPARYEVAFGPSRLRKGDDFQGPAAFGLLEAAIERGLRAGDLGDGTARQLAGSTWSLLHGVCELTLNGRLGPATETGETAEEMAVRSVRLLLAGTHKSA
jgi:AcrR family transcriptional regulator